jgi:2-polyprenyl-3-methyl-5-hydroxy-6-metoxy-1,4-benzoquinol methylase
MQCSVTAKEFFSRLYGRHAEAYRRQVDAVVARNESHSRLAILRWVNARPGEHVLDLACGPGTLSVPLAEAVAPEGEVVGIDLSRGMIKQAQDSVPKSLPLRFALMDMEQLSFGGGRFDVVTCGHGLHFSPNLSAVFAEIGRVLKFGGRFAASMPVRSESRAFPILDRVAGLLEIPTAPTLNDLAATRQTIADPTALRELAINAGLSSVAVARLDELSTCPDPVSFIGMVADSIPWIARLETIPIQNQEAFLKQAESTLARELGPGPIQVFGVCHVLYAKA